MIIIKTPEQIEKLRTIGHKHSSIFQKITPMMIPGTNSTDLDDFIATEVRRDGDKPAFLGYRPDWASYPYPKSSCISVNDVIVHGIPSKDLIFKDGDIVSVDFGIRREDVCTDAAMTFLIGGVSDELIDLSQKTYAALQTGIHASHVGNTVGDIGRAIWECNAGQYGIVRDLAGHGVGVHLHEPPLVPNFFDKKSADTELQPGMVLAIEPMFTIGSSGDVSFSKDEYTVYTRDGSAAAHWEQNVLITDDGPEILIKD